MPAGKSAWARSLDVNAPDFEVNIESIMNIYPKASTRYSRDTIAQNYNDIHQSSVRQSNFTPSIFPPILT